MELRYLKVFLAAGEALNFRQAAEVLGIAQPAVTQQVKALEAELGFPLFHRLPRGVELTAAGHAMLPEIRAALAQIDRAVHVARSAQRGQLGHLRVGYSGSLMVEHALPALLQRFRRENPGVTFGFVTGGVHALLERLHAHELDVAFVRAPVAQLPTSLQTQLFSRCRLLAVVAHGHKLAEHDSIPLAALANESIIAMDDPPGIGLGAQVLDVLEAAGFAANIRVRMPDVASIMGLVSAGVGAAIMPEAVVRSSAQVHPLEITDHALTSAALMVHRRQYPVPALQRFLQAGAEMAHAAAQRG